MNFTAERSLEIITEQIKRSRKAVSQEVGLSLYISGLCIMGMAIIITTCVLLTGNTLFYLLYGLIPVLVIGRFSIDLGQNSSPILCHYRVLLP